MMEAIRKESGDFPKTWNNNKLIHLIRKLKYMKE